MNTKTPLKIFIICALLPFISSAQQKIVVNEVIKEMSKGTKNGYDVIIPEAMLREVKADFSHYIRKDSKSRAQEADGELFIIGAVNKNIFSTPFNIYAKLQDADDGVKITAFFTPDDTLFVSTADNEDQSSAIKKYLKEFAVTQYKDFVKKELDSEKRKQKELENQLEDLVNSKQKSERNINEAKRTIENNNRDIESVAKQITAKEDEIIKQKGMVSTLKGSGGEEEKLSQKNLKNLENDKRKLDKDKESMARENDKMNSRMEDEQRNIETSMKLQLEKNTEIEKQKSKVQKTEEKFNGIL
ncbi:MAG TPA: hypothetical protein VJY62_04515 [Bacteroidia bacterium]|nr:hypothetical protein [Bacteroidia bacterium]